LEFIQAGQSDQIVSCIKAFIDRAKIAETVT
jgi:hypothetical protein